MIAVIEGARCKGCHRPETFCASKVLDGGCCPACTHWRSYDRHGNERRYERFGAALPKGEVCGTEVGYSAHLTHQTAPCEARVAAHEETRITPVSVLFTPERCRKCGRRTAHNKDGQRRAHRVKADNPLAPMCEGDGYGW